MAGMSLDGALARRFAAITLGHVTQEWPNKLDHVLAGPADLLAPRALHPVFFGSFDWHSCVHAFWMLARLLRRFPEGAAAPAIRALFDARLTEANIAVECAYLDRPLSRGFERPYGWAWLLKLAAELRAPGLPYRSSRYPSVRHRSCMSAEVQPLHLCRMPHHHRQGLRRAGGNVDGNGSFLWVNHCSVQSHRPKCLHAGIETPRSAAETHPGTRPSPCVV